MADLGKKWTFNNHRQDKGFLSRPPTRNVNPGVKLQCDDVNIDAKNQTIVSTSKSFVPYRVEFLIKDLLETELKGVKYDPTLCSSLAQDLCVKIKERTKRLDYPHHRFVCQVIIGQDTEHNVQISSRCLWNHTTDNFAASTFRNSAIYAIAVVYAMHVD